MARRQGRRRGHIEERPNGTFRAVVFAGADPLTGKLRYLKETTRTKAQAEIELTKLQKQVDEQRHPSNAVTVEEIIERWQPQHASATRV